MERNDEYAPLILLQGDGSDNISLMLTDFDATAEVFEQAGYEGGGYGWHGVADALVRKQAPKLKRKLDYDPEASMFVAFSKDRTAIEQLAQLLLEAIRDPEVLRAALADAKPDLME